MIESLLDIYRTSGDREWVMDARCAGQTELFYPPTVDFLRPNFHEPKAERLIRVEKAKQLCGKCAVRDNCLNYALKHKEYDGIWGGLTEKERGRLYKA